jgi:hypothetical protein
MLRLARHAQPAIIVINDQPLRRCTSFVRRPVTDRTARNVNGKLVKKDLKPGLVIEWNSRQAKQTRSKL